MSFYKSLIDKYIEPNEQGCYDPYDIWNTNLGQKVKTLYYKNKFIGLLPAGAFTVYDYYINNFYRFGYKKKEYPMVYAFRALIAIELYKTHKKTTYLKIAENSVCWLKENYCKGYSGYCWGANMPWVSKNATYAEETPYITNTPYALEALDSYYKISGDERLICVIRSIYDFVEKDLAILLDQKHELALSYSPTEEKRIVVNANSYALLCYSIFLSYFPEKAKYIRSKIQRISTYIKRNQRKDGSWLYYADRGAGNFVDCFHTCFILKNLFKVNERILLEEGDKVIVAGYNYLKKNLWDENKKLFRRFSITDSFSLVKYDLYDNAEVLHLAQLLQDEELVATLHSSIKNNFVVGTDIYSRIILFNKKVNKNMLRWAVMPYLFALSQFEKTAVSNEI